MFRAQLLTRGFRSRAPILRSRFRGSKFRVQRLLGKGFRVKVNGAYGGSKGLGLVVLWLITRNLRNLGEPCWDHCCNTEPDAYGYSKNGPYYDKLFAQAACEIRFSESGIGGAHFLSFILEGHMFEENPQTILTLFARPAYETSRPHVLKPSIFHSK